VSRFRFETVTSATFATECKYITLHQCSQKIFPRGSLMVSTNNHRTSYSCPCTYGVRTIFFFIERQWLCDRASAVSRLHDRRHTHTRYGSSGRVISPTQRPLPDNTILTKKQTSMPLGRFEPAIPSKRTAADPRLRPRDQWDRRPGVLHTKLKIYLKTDFRELRIHTSSTRNNAVHDLTLIKLTVIRFVGSGVSELYIVTVIRHKHIAN
jgi:hypothetical protein